MNDTFATMERCASLAEGADPDAVGALIELLSHHAWQVRFAAAVGLGDRRDKAAVPALLKLLEAEDAAPIYTQPTLEIDATGTKVSFPEGTDEKTHAAWARRWRIKQAVLLSLGQIGYSEPAMLRDIAAKAVNQDEGYPVRAAACHALATLADATCLAALQAAARDDEFCTKTEGIKALAALKERLAA